VLDEICTDSEGDHSFTFLVGSAMKIVHLHTHRVFHDLWTLLQEVIS